jgi:polyketide biosynthesis 3-hydroxy-3-methylglutaryl-CoA synthase-like enzyme PksG
MLSLTSTIEHGEFETPQRVGVFSYGSGCCSEFFSGVVTKEGQERVRAMRIKTQLDKRCELTMDEYDALLAGSSVVKFGTRNVVLDTGFLARARHAQGNGTVFLTEIKDFQRQYGQVA